MAGSMTDYLENAVLNLLLGNVSYSVPATVYFALYTTAPGETGGGTEVTGGSYTRVAVTNNTTNFATVSNSTKRNSTAINFPTATADWGTVVAVGIFDALSAGNLLFYSTLDQNKVISNGDSASFSINAITITLD